MHFPRLSRAMAAGGMLALLGAATAHADGSFSHVGTFSVPANLRAGEPIETVTSAEIVASADAGRTLIYTDSPAKRLGFVDIRRPNAPAPGGALDMGGEPTSVATVGDFALVAVNTSPSFAAPSGELVIVHTGLKRVLKRLPLAGQPDSIAVSPDKRYAAIVIENERDEDLGGGQIPQAPAGALQVVDLLKLLFSVPFPSVNPIKTVSLQSLAAVAPSDPEPEFVDINDRNQAVVTLQENNHLAIVDLARARVTRHFSAGRVTVGPVDTVEDGVIAPTATMSRLREPDAVKWIDDDTFATANEGDYAPDGGSRSFTFFNAQTGRVEYESGASFEHELIRAGHYPEGRSDAKGNEPEGLEVATFGRTKYLFVGSERANAVGVYELEKGKPEFRHVLATGIGPEGLKAIPGRGLLAVSAETDGKADGFEIRSLVTLYDLRGGAPAYPELVSDGIPWAAMSGLAGDPRDRNTLWAVSDSVLSQAFLYRVDVARHPAVIRQRIAIGGVTGEYDLEGVAARRDGGFWLASEGNASRPNQLVRIDGAGTVLERVLLPASLTAGATTSGFEGLTVTGQGASETVYAAIQREWADDERGYVKLARYEVAKKRWTFVRYKLDAVEAPTGGWVGLSELSLLPDGRTAVIIERDDRIALDARVKRLYTVDLTSATWREHGQPLDTIRKRLARDVRGDLDAHSISVPDKLEGLGVAADGEVFLATDNDGVDGNYGETLFFGVGRPTWR